MTRHRVTTLLAHWLTALSTFVLLFTGFGQMPMYKRYMVDSIPGLGWSSNYAVTLQLHYAAAMVLVFAAIFHLVFHGSRREFSILPRRGDVKESYQIVMSMLGRCQAPPCDKYLAEQRLAYAYIAGTLMLLIVTGMFKVVKNMAGVNMPDSWLNLATNLHNAGTVLLILGILGHLAAFIFKENRSLLPAMFTGKVDAEYARERHRLWYQKVSKKHQKSISL
ncbi:membrane protein [Clostridiales bacterium PH28_bin88]|nr:membrane protein [Clostridiales bacterium PH28_bin88]